MTVDDESLCAALELYGSTIAESDAANRIRALSARLDAAEKMAEALRETAAHPGNTWYARQALAAWEEAK